MNNIDNMSIFYIYLIIIFITYIILRYKTISGDNDDPLIITLIVSVIWPLFLITYILIYFFRYLDILLRKIYIIKELIKNKEINKEINK